MKIFAIILVVLFSGQHTVPSFADEANRLVILAAIAASKNEPPTAEIVLPKVSTSINWQPYSKIKKQGKGGLVYIHDNPNCAQCVAVERECFSDPAVIEQFNKFPVVSKVKWTKEWRGSVPSVPSLAIIGPDNTILATVTCPSKPDALLGVFKE